MSETEPIDVEAIMQQIRQQILARKQAEAGADRPLPALQGKRFPPEFYEHLYHAGMMFDQIDVRMHVSKVNIPILGRWIEWLRGKVHELVLYYVNQVAAQQIKVNHHLLQAISIMSRELEQAAAADRPPQAHEAADSVDSLPVPRLPDPDPPDAERAGLA